MHTLDGRRRQRLGFAPPITYPRPEFGASRHFGFSDTFFVSFSRMVALLAVAALNRGLVNKASVYGSRVVALLAVAAFRLEFVVDFDIRGENLDGDGPILHRSGAMAEGFLTGRNEAHCRRPVRPARGCCVRR